MKKFKKAIKEKVNEIGVGYLILIGINIIGFVVAVTI